MVAVQRESRVIPDPPPDFKLSAGDVLVVFGERHQISAFERQCGEMRV